MQQATKLKRCDSKLLLRARKIAEKRKTLDSAVAKTTKTNISAMRKAEKEREIVRALENAHKKQVQ